MGEMEIEAKKPKGLLELFKEVAEKMRGERAQQSGFMKSAREEAPAAKPSGFLGFSREQESRINELRKVNPGKVDQFLADAAAEASDKVPKPKATGPDALLASINYEKKFSEAWAAIVGARLDAFESEIRKSAFV